MMTRFHDRIDAGKILARRLIGYGGDPKLLVLALPRGGVPVGFEVARALRAPLDVYVVRKLGVPGYPELAMGAVASGGAGVINEEVVAALGIPTDLVEEVAAAEAKEIARREWEYRDGRPPPDIRDRTIILVDDGLATGSSMRAAVAALRQHGPARTIVAVPVASPDTCDALRKEADEVVCAMTPEPFYAVGLWYEDFTQTTDEEVRDLLSRAALPFPEPRDTHAPGG